MNPAEHIHSPRSIAHGKGLILVMDDEEIIRVIAADMLSVLGYHVETCASGEELIDLYRNLMAEGERPSAVIMDIIVPGKMGGVDAASRILEFDSAAVLIVSSGYSNDPILARHQEYGFCDVLAKPFRVEEMGAVLAKVMQERVPAEDGCAAA